MELAMSEIETSYFFLGSTSEITLVGQKSFVGVPWGYAGGLDPVCLV